ncbi:hypothetical protein TVAG_072400 [Trichomonas vaginalis G3]|uniref:Uncharacterized protein n=1 Tax=Trichomonas vaginalis (strain ATCC PRA-98 / G3) TaxID=412133 RepID=A2EUC4_TRIV3|nr:microtubule binding [Trichomonas vaginalis G3]EAY03748.1 hypothetical protein TVAG_072400 [Trichomonas vaginalis G3]KAI5532704.1 microtubule binding [Trichomonas vaginalis G3]|eukprot:XP_001315971.1 hypothetical protein [Trichomonas vaginalis G3]
MIDESEELDTTTLRQLWKQLELTDDQMEEIINNIRHQILDAKKEFLDLQVFKCTQMHEATLKRLHTMSELLKSIKAPQEDIDSFQNIFSNEKSLRQVNNEMDSYFEKYKDAILERQKQFEEVITSINQLYDTIGFPEQDRGDFSRAEYEDLSEDRLIHLQEQNKILTETVSRRKESFEQRSTALQKLLIELGEDFTQDMQNIISSTVYSQQNIETLDYLLNQYQTEYDVRKEELSKLAIQLTSLWQLLDTPENDREIVLKQKDLSKKSLEVARNEVIRLNAEKDQRLDEVIGKLSNEIDELSQILHMPKENIDELLGGQFTDEKTYFLQLHNLVINLRKLLVDEKPILDLIEQREDIINQYESNRNDEKAKRRYKTVLPRLDKKIKVALEDFERTRKQPLLYDGVPYITRLDKVIVTNLERSNFRRRKSSLSYL